LGTKGEQGRLSPTPAQQTARNHNGRLYDEGVMLCVKPRMEMGGGFRVSGDWDESLENDSIVLYSIIVLCQRIWKMTLLDIAGMGWRQGYFAYVIGCEILDTNCLYEWQALLMASENECHVHPATPSYMSATQTRQYVNLVYVPD
jgi:hypothetical protein